jgi:hypothetical protein
MEVQPKYKIAEDGGSIICLACGCTSFNPNDVKMRYCAACHSWLDSACDFCSERSEFARDYIAESQIKGVLSDGRALVDGDGLWAACMVCSLLIEAQAWEPLIQRVIATHRWDAADMRPRVIFMYQTVFGEKFTVEK